MSKAWTFELLRCVAALWGRRGRKGIKTAWDGIRAKEEKKVRRVFIGTSEVLWLRCGPPSETLLKSSSSLSAQHEEWHLIAILMLTHKFAYCPNWSKYNAIAHILHSTLSHLDNKRSYERLQFIDYSWVVNTISPGWSQYSRSLD